MPTWAAVGVGAAGLIGGAQSASSATSAAESAAAGAGYTGTMAQQLNEDRFEQAQAYLEPYIADAQTAQQQYLVEMGLAEGTPGTAYRETPGYQAMIDEGIRTVNTGAAGAGMLYSGRRGRDLRDMGAQVQNQAYTNYMNQLQSLASPAVAQNLSALGVNQGLSSGNQMMATQQTQAGYNLMGTQAQGAAVADVFGGLTNLYSGYMQSQVPTTNPVPASV